MTVDVVNNLKQDVIKEYLTCIDNLNKGHDAEYDIILHEIAFISMITEYSDKEIPGLYEYFMDDGRPN